MKRVLILSAIFFLLFLMVSCGENSSFVKSGLGESCTKTTDCEDGLKCIDLVCVDDDTGDTGNTGNTGDTGNTADDSDSGNTGNTSTDIDSDDTGNTADDSDSDIGTMADVPAGVFQMGCNEAVDYLCYYDESPYHAVTLSAYKIDKYEVTVGEYQKCVDAGDCNNNNGDEPQYKTKDDMTGCNLGSEEKLNHPVNCVSWYGAFAFCEWAGKRLPTEAEWEKAARGTDGKIYPWGNEAVSCDYAIIYNGVGGCGTDSTWEVGSIEAGVSPYGAYDMSGNVWEWVNDFYSDTYYSESPSNDPAGAEPYDYRVFRGGSWFEDIEGSTRTSVRGFGLLNVQVNSIGFRCAK